MKQIVHIEQICVVECSNFFIPLNGKRDTFCQELCLAKFILKFKSGFQDGLKNETK